MKKYGLNWDNVDDAQIERFCIRKGGRWQDAKGVTRGLGLFHHYRALQSALWPDEDHHRWSDLILKAILENRITVLMGARDSGKTRTVSKYALCDYWCFALETLILMSSTTIAGLELRVWGDVKHLFQLAKGKFPWLPGNVIDSKRGIFTDDLDEESDVRDMRRGLICVPTMDSQGNWTGSITKFVGIKQKRRRLLGDEVQFVPVNYVDVMSNLDKGDFKGVFAGNPVGANGKALDKVAEPINGWGSICEPTKTTVWPNKFQGVTINLVGTDSPNFDSNRPKHYSYLIDHEDVKRVEARSGKDSADFYTFILGVRKTGVDAHRVLTTEICEHNGAFKDVIWEGGERTRIYAIDAGYGGDACESMFIEFGKEVGGKIVIKFSDTIFIPVKVSGKETPEDQIAGFAKVQIGLLNVPPANVFFDAGMRATLAISMSRVISPEVNAVNFGGTATDRPVNNDLFVMDESTKQRRLKTCKEHYSKFVTELWFSVRECVTSGQARGLPKEVAEEFGMREWRYVQGFKYELETKLECKERMGHSPDKADATAIAVEGARRRGFVIDRMSGGSAAPPPADDWLSRERQKHKKFRSEHELKYG